MYLNIAFLEGMVETGGALLTFILFVLIIWILGNFF